MLALIAVLFVPVPYVVISIMEARRKTPTRSDLVRKSIIALMQVLAATSYFYGDNITYILQRYAQELGCNQQCVINNRTATVVSLGHGNSMLQLLPSVILKLDYTVGWKDKKYIWYNAHDLITIILKIDIVYTAVAVMAQRGEFCGTDDVSISVSFLVLCLIAGTGVMVISAVYFIQKTSNDNYAKFYILGGLIVLVPSFLMYMLADNQQPIDCAFGCDSFASNTTDIELTCNTSGSSGLRLGLMVPTFVAVLVVGLVLICKDVYSTAEDDETDGGEKEKSHPV